MCAYQGIKYNWVYANMIDEGKINLKYKLFLLTEFV